MPELDFNRASRQGDAPDVGATEYVGEGDPDFVIREAGLLPGPMLALGALRRRRR